MTEGSAAEPGGLVQVFTAHRAELLRFLTARCGDAEAASDLLQDLWLKLETLEIGPIANGRAYLFRMANNLVLDASRAHRRAMARDRAWLEAEGDPAALPELRPDPGLPADEEVARRQEAEVLARAIASLPPGAQRALRLAKLEERSQTEVAEIMGISRSGVEKHLAVAMKHLRAALADCGMFISAESHRQDDAGDGESPAGQRV